MESSSKWYKLYLQEKLLTNVIPDPSNNCKADSDNVSAGEKGTTIDNLKKIVEDLSQEILQLKTGSINVNQKPIVQQSMFNNNILNDVNARFVEEKNVIFMKLKLSERELDSALQQETIAKKRVYNAILKVNKLKSALYSKPRVTFNERTEELKPRLCFGPKLSRRCINLGASPSSSYGAQQSSHKVKSEYKINIVRKQQKSLLPQVEESKEQKVINELKQGYVKLKPTKQHLKINHEWNGLPTLSEMERKLHSLKPILKNDHTSKRNLDK